jgi:protein tyrosine phosphatase type 4A
MSSNKVKHLVRATECTYAVERANKVGITVHDMAFPDGEPPPQDIIKRWLKLCQTTFAAKDGSAISVHCVAGLGRAPVLVAIALIEKGLEPLDAVALIRDKRKGAINSKQVRVGRVYTSRVTFSLHCGSLWQTLHPPLPLTLLLPLLLFLTLHLSLPLFFHLHHGSLTT